MKKYFALIITVIILSLSLCVTTFATQKKTIKLSDDYKEMYFGGNTYTRVDASMLRYVDEAEAIVDYYTDDKYYDDALTVTAGEDPYYTTILTEEQHKEVKMVEILSTNHNETIFLIRIDFYDGAELFIDFIREDMIDEYNKVRNGDTDEYYIDFRYPEKNTVSLKKEIFFAGDRTKIDFWEYEYEFNVYADSPSGSFDVEIGILFKIGTDYYFCSYIESGTSSWDEWYEYSSDNKVDAIKITDEEALESIKIAEEMYLEDEFGYLFNDELTETVAKIFFTLIFAILPLAIAVTSLILAIKSKKGLYKKLLLVTSGLSLASVATFIYIAFTLFKS